MRCGEFVLTTEHGKARAEQLLDAGDRFMRFAAMVETLCQCIFAVRLGIGFEEPQAQRVPRISDDSGIAASPHRRRSVGACSGIGFPAWQARRRMGGGGTWPAL